MLFFLNDTATSEIYTLSLHDALPVSAPLVDPDRNPASPTVAGRFLVVAHRWPARRPRQSPPASGPLHAVPPGRDRKSTRLNSSHANISYAVFCLKKTYSLPLLLLAFL